MSHPFWTLEVSPQQGFLLLTPCPGSKKSSLEDSLDELAAAGCTLVITLMQSEEMSRNGLDQIAEQCQARGMSWQHWPVQDDKAPEQAFEQAFEQGLAEVEQCLANNKGIALHCKGGSGRTGLAAARILLAKGWNLAKAKPAIQELRPNALSLQVHCDYIKRFA